MNRALLPIQLTWNIFRIFNSLLSHLPLSRKRLKYCVSATWSSIYKREWKKELRTEQSREQRPVGWSLSCTVEDEGFWQVLRKDRLLRRRIEAVILENSCVLWNFKPLLFRFVVDSRAKPDAMQCFLLPWSKLSVTSLEGWVPPFWQELPCPFRISNLSELEK